MSKRHFLEFEQPVSELESKIEELRYVQNESAVDISEEIDRLGKKSLQLIKDIYAHLTPWQVTQIARHPQRPYTLDYVHEIFTDFQELHGDRAFADDQSIVGGLARFNGQACMVLGHQKGRDTKERGLRNFGMSRPFWWPITMQAWPLKRASPPMIDWSSAKARSPCSSWYSVKISVT